MGTPRSHCHVQLSALFAVTPPAVTGPLGYCPLVPEVRNRALCQHLSSSSRVKAISSQVAKIDLRSVSIRDERKPYTNRHAEKCWPSRRQLPRLAKSVWHFSWKKLPVRQRFSAAINSLKIFLLVSAFGTSLAKYLFRNGRDIYTPSLISLPCLSSRPFHFRTLI